MTSQCPDYYCFRPRANSPLLLQLTNQRVSSRSGCRKMAVAVAKVLVALGPVVLAVNLWLFSSVNTLESAVLAAQEVRQGLLETQARLQAKRDRLYAPERIRMLAAEQFSLYVPD